MRAKQVGSIKKARISQRAEFLACSCGSFVTNSALAITRGGYETPTTRRFHGAEFLPTRHMPLWFSVPKRARAVSATRQPPESRKTQQPSRLSCLKQYVTPPPRPTKTYALRASATWSSARVASRLRRRVAAFVCYSRTVTRDRAGDQPRGANTHRNNPRAPYQTHPGTRPPGTSRAQSSRGLQLHVCRRANSNSTTPPSHHNRMFACIHNHTRHICTPHIPKTPTKHPRSQPRRSSRARRAPAYTRALSTTRCRQPRRPAATPRGLLWSSQHIYRSDRGSDAALLSPLPSTPRIYPLQEVG